MKKIISLMLVLFTVVLLVACDNAELPKSDIGSNNQEPIGVCSITYSTGGSPKILRSIIRFEVIIESASASDYENATEKSGLNSVGSLDEEDVFLGVLNVDRTVANSTIRLFDGKTVDEVKTYVGKEVYCNSYDYDYSNNIYYKITITDIHVDYVTVSFYDDCLTVSSLNEDLYNADKRKLKYTTMRIKAENYEVVFFTDK